MSSKALAIQRSHTWTICSVSGTSRVPRGTISPSILMTLTFRTPLAVKKTLLRSGKTIPLVSKICLLSFAGCLFSHVLIQPLKCSHFQQKHNYAYSWQRNADVLALLSLDAPTNNECPEPQVPFYSLPRRPHRENTMWGRLRLPAVTFQCHIQLFEGHPVL